MTDTQIMGRRALINSRLWLSRAYITYMSGKQLDRSGVGVDTRSFCSVRLERRYSPPISIFPRMKPRSPRCKQLRPRECVKEVAEWVVEERE